MSSTMALRDIWLDLDGEGLSGVLTEQAGGWYYKPNRGDGQFGLLRQVVPQPAMAMAAGSRHQFMDLAGDGAIDVVDFSGPIPGFRERDQDEGWTRHVPFASLPNINWQDATLRFLDLTGDGQADAFITEHEVFTWYPSLDERGFAASERTRQAKDEDDGPRSYLWELTIPWLEAQDPMAAARQAICHGDFRCNRASLGHPNVEGAKAIAEAIRPHLAR